MPAPDALLFSSAARLLASLRAHEISATELVDAHLAERAPGGYQRPPDA